MNTKRFRTLGGMVMVTMRSEVEYSGRLTDSMVLREGRAFSSALRVGNELPGRDWAAGGRAEATLLGWGGGGGGELGAGAGADAGMMAAAGGGAWGGTVGAGGGMDWGGGVGAGGEAGDGCGGGGGGVTAGGALRLPGPRCLLGVTVHCSLALGAFSSVSIDGLEDSEGGAGSEGEGEDELVVGGVRRKSARVALGGGGAAPLFLFSAGGVVESAVAEVLRRLPVGGFLVEMAAAAPRTEKALRVWTSEGEGDEEDMVASRSSESSSVRSWTLSAGSAGRAVVVGGVAVEWGEWGSAVAVEVGGGRVEEGVFEGGVEAAGAGG